mmetsp:Transcript_45716/g.118159  ORF Transcript_45716/g.118159 Transcript_45716/m.118159 type:complete len:760 (-) Transcript_45716:163-2442(-)
MRKLLHSARRWLGAAGGSVDAWLSPNCRFDLLSFNSTAPVIEVNAGVSAPSLLSTVDGRWFSLPVGKASPVQSKLSLLSIPHGGYMSTSSLLFRRVDIMSISTADVRLVKGNLLPVTNLSCPFGYSFAYTFTLLPLYDPELEVKPYSCSSPFSANVPSCNAPAYSAFITCTSCPSNYISLKQGRADANQTWTIANTNSVQQRDEIQCKECPPQFIYKGAASIQAQTGYWFPPLPLLWQYYNWSWEDVILACPPSACQPATPFEFSDGVLQPDTSMCSTGRDMESKLCSMCLANHSTDLISKKCYSSSVVEQWPASTVVFLVFFSILILAYLVFLHLKPLGPQSPWLRIIVNYFSVVGLLHTSTDGGGGSLIVGGILRILSAFSSPISHSSPSLRLVLPGAQPIDVHLMEGVVSLCVGAVFAVSIAARWGLAKAAQRSQLRTRLLLGIFTLLLLSYSSISELVFSFLTCVDVPILDNITSSTAVLSMESRLWIHAEWQCWTAYVGWSVLLVFGLLFVFGFPLGLYIWQGLFPSNDRWMHRLHLRYSHLRRRSKGSAKQASGPSWSGVSVIYLLEGRLKEWYWDVLLFYRRALFALVFVFAPFGMLQQVFFAVLSVAFFALHIHYNPYDSQLANLTETVSYVLLLFINILNFPSVSFLTNNVELTESSRTFLQHTVFAQSVLASAGLVVLVLALACAYGWKLVKVVTVRRHALCLPCKRKFNSNCLRRAKHRTTVSKKRGDVDNVAITSTETVRYSELTDI